MQHVGKAGVSNVPGLHDLHRMTAQLLAEAAPDVADILVVGAGGGMEIAAMGGTRPNWRFVGVDPSAEMLTLACQTTKLINERVELIEGIVDDVPVKTFDGATCLFVLHHVESSEQLRILRSIRRRLRPGSRFVFSEHAAIGVNPEVWLARSVSFSQGGGIESSEAAARAAMMHHRLSLHTPNETEAMLRDAGFCDPDIFYAAFSLRGWVATA
ncbi:methyltransferase domain-containing protein [Altererythrobacter confluentis]|uniref:Methyltransferase domain-containing protein n=1 Tax=Allopontixanthobacter confluentis TaxID=1849021 RepID=A0A6L7GGR7_9SPHN|nr:methyltransferase domain-containing protein [Allopontixanthobacter confluentis]